MRKIRATIHYTSCVLLFLACLSIAQVRLKNPSYSETQLFVAVKINIVFCALCLLSIILTDGKRTKNGKY